MYSSKESEKLEKVGTGQGKNKRQKQQMVVDSNPTAWKRTLNMNGSYSHQC